MIADRFALAEDVCRAADDFLDVWTAATLFDDVADKTPELRRRAIEVERTLSEAVRRWRREYDR